MEKEEKEKLADYRKLISEDFPREIGKRIVGHKKEIRQIIICLFSAGAELRTHVLLEGVPGIAKTDLAKTITKIIAGKFARIQGTPDILASDIRGVDIFDTKKEEFRTEKGPVFTNILLVDEINRMTGRAQSALLDAMEEGGVTIGGKTYVLDDPFLVLATQNPIEHEAVYPLPEAQIDRFTMKIRLGYGSKKDARAIVDMGNEARPKIERLLEIEKILEIRSLIRDVIKIDERQKDYIVELVYATRPETTSLDRITKEVVLCGASNRALMALEAASRVHAFLRGGDAVLPDDIDEVALPILRHRIIINPMAVPEEKGTADFVDELIQGIILEIGKEYRS